MIIIFRYETPVDNKQDKTIIEKINKQAKRKKQLHPLLKMKANSRGEGLE